MGLFDFLKRKNTSPDAMSAHTLADIARGMQHAVNSASEMADQQYLRLFELYFEDDEEGRAKAKVKKFLLPNGDEIAVPIINLIPPAGLNLERMKVKMAVRIDKTETKQGTKGGAADHVTRTSFQCSFSPRTAEEGRNQNVMDVEMLFIAGDPPEGVSRVIEGYINQVIPKRQGPPAPPAPESPAAPPALPPGESPTSPP